jgi:hypothetical protein
MKTYEPSDEGRKIPTATLSHVIVQHHIAGHFTTFENTFATSELVTHNIENHRLQHQKHNEKCC